jgi:hypothetical protein
MLLARDAIPDPTRYYARAVGPGAAAYAQGAAKTPSVRTPDIIFFPLKLLFEPRRSKPDHASSIGCLSSRIRLQLETDAAALVVTDDQNHLVAEHERLADNLARFWKRLVHDLCYQ